MLIAIIVAFFIGGSSGTAPMLAAFDQAQAAVRKQVDDGGRRAQLVKAIGQAEDAIKAAQKNQGKGIEELVELLRAHDGKPADMQPALQRVRADAETAQQQLIRARLELKERMSRDEWQKVFSPR